MTERRINISPKFELTFDQDFPRNTKIVSWNDDVVTIYEVLEFITNLRAHLPYFKRIYCRHQLKSVIEYSEVLNMGKKKVAYYHGFQIESDMHGRILNWNTLNNKWVDLATVHGACLILKAYIESQK